MRRQRWIEARRQPERSPVVRFPRLPLYARVLIGAARRKPVRIVRLLMSFWPLYVTHV